MVTYNFQMLDMIHPAVPGKISLSDLKRCKMTAIFFDTFFNVEKYLDHEQRDPFASARDHDADGHEVLNFFPTLISFQQKCLLKWFSILALGLGQIRS